MKELVEGFVNENNYVLQTVMEMRTSKTRERNLQGIKGHTKIEGCLVAIW